MFNDRYLALYTDLDSSDPTGTGKVQEVKTAFIKSINDYAVAVLPA